MSKSLPLPHILPNIRDREEQRGGSLSVENLDTGQKSWQKLVNYPGLERVPKVPAYSLLIAIL